jgi:ADP-heptose:LPS heptosyltransferase
MASWPTLFQHDPRVSCVLPWNSVPLHDWASTVFKNYNQIISHDPYRSDFLKGDKHIITSWAEMYEVEIDDKLPNFHINKRREKELEKEILKLGKFILVQFTGGQGVQDSNYDENNSGRNYKRGQEIIDLIKEGSPNLNILVFGHPNEQEPLLNTMAFNNFGGLPKFADKEDFMVLAKYCLSFICIDSSLQHICSNKYFNKKGIVLWGTSHPLMYGYEKNINLRSEYPYCVDIEPKKIVDNFFKQEI